MICVCIDMRESSREVLLGIVRGYPVRQDECPVCDRCRYVVETPAEQSSRGNMASVDIPEL